MRLTLFSDSLVFVCCLREPSGRAQGPGHSKHSEKISFSG